MQKHALLCLSLIVATIPAIAPSQTPSASKPTVPANRKAASEAPKQNLSDDFAKSGIKALRAIERELGEVSVNNGSIAVPRQTQELIDNADAEARTDDEKAVVAALNSFFLGRVINNLERDNFLLEFGSYSAERRAQGQTALASDTHNIEMTSREAACSHLLDEILRSRHYMEKPAACYEVNPPKNTPAKDK